MKLIAHRGNIYGPDPAVENSPDYIDQALKDTFDVEVDIRYIEDKFYLGHDEPTYFVDFVWLKERKDNLWLHCKNLEALYILKENFNAFYHKDDDYTLTSFGYIWTYPTAKPGPSCIFVDLLYPTQESFEYWRKNRITGVCTDYTSFTASVITSIMN